MERVTSWRLSERARWLGWTVVFGLLFAGVIGSSFYDLVPTVNRHLGLGILVLTLVAAFAIGVRFPSPWWPMGPPFAVIATVLMFLLLRPISSPEATAPGMTTPKDEFVLMLVWGGWIVFGLLAGIYAVLAWVGVAVGWWASARRSS